MDNSSDPTIKFNENGYCNYCTTELNRKDNVYFPNEKGKQKERRTKREKRILFGQ